MLESYKAVFFDAGGTLLHPYPSVGEIYAKYAAKHGAQVQAGDVEKRFRTVWLERDSLHHSRVHATEKIERAWWHELVREVFEPLARFEDFESFFTELYDVFARADYWRLYPGVLEVLKKIRFSGKKIGVVSNWDSRLFSIFKGLEIESCFDFILASAVFGASKPSPKIFQEALRLSGVRPHEAVHIGDSFEDDIRGAQNAGLAAILIERHPGHRVLRETPTILSFQELIV